MRLCDRSQRSKRDPTTAPVPDPEALECECLAIRAVALALKDDSAAALPVAEASLKRKPGDPSTFNGVSNAARFAHWKAGDLKSFHNTPWLPFSEEQEKRNVFVRVYRLCLQGLVELQQMRVASAERTYLEAMRMAEQHVRAECRGGSSPGQPDRPDTLRPRAATGRGRFDYRPHADHRCNRDVPTVSCGLISRSPASHFTAGTQMSTSIRCWIEQKICGHARQWGRLVSAVLLERLRLHVAEGRIVEADASPDQTGAIGAGPSRAPTLRVVGNPRSCRDGPCRSGRSR